MKEKLLKFIKQKEPYITEVFSFVKVDYDGEYENGIRVTIGSHYVVKCILHLPKKGPSGPVLFEDVERACLVDVKVFEKWLENEQSVTWI